MMYNLDHYYEKIKDDAMKMDELKTVIEEALDELPDDKYWEAVYKIHCIVYGPHFDCMTAKKAVAAMKNVDGTTGEHWNMEQTDSVAMQYGITQTADFYYVINMMYSDYSNIFGSDTNMYAKMAKAYMTDPDAPEGKTFDLWIARMRAKDHK